MNSQMRASGDIPGRGAPVSWFDVNGRIGTPSRGNPEYRGPADLIAHMDRLGVAKSLTCHVSARDLDPSWGNRLLLEEINGTASASGRLIPALVMGASTLHETGALEELTGHLRNHRVGAIRVFPKRLNHSLAQLAPALEKLRERVRAVLVDYADLHAPEELGDLAGQFEGTRFICTGAAWSDLPAALELLREHTNILLDTSLIHTCGTLEAIVRTFGAARLVFGLGHRTNGGASIAELASADLDANDRETIAHRNAEEIFGMAAEGPAPEAFPTEGTGRLWNRMRRGSLDGIQIIDAHGHLGPVGTWMLPRQQIDQQIPDMIFRMDQMGIRTMIVSGTHALFGDPVSGNQLLERTVTGNGDRFRGYLVFNPHYHEELTPLLPAFLSGGFFVGFKLLSSYWGVPVTDERYRAVWRHAHKHRLPILLHTWSDDFDLPMMLDGIAAEHPEAVFILGHSGGTDAGRASALQLAERHANVFLEWCGSYRMTLPYEDLIRTLGPDRFLFGTDAALHSPAWELGRFLSLDLPDEMLLPALGDTMRKILAKRK